MGEYSVWRNKLVSEVRFLEPAPERLHDSGGNYSNNHYDHDHWDAKYDAPDQERADPLQTGHQTSCRGSRNRDWTPTRLDEGFGEPVRNEVEFDCRHGGHVFEVVDFALNAIDVAAHFGQLFEDVENICRLLRPFSNGGEHLPQFVLGCVQIGELGAKIRKFFRNVLPADAFIADTQCVLSDFGQHAA